MYKIVNIHIPKTGGLSFYHSLKDFFKNDILEFGHGIDRDINILTKQFENFNESIQITDYNNIDLISGHNFAIKYKKLYDYGWKFITWIREPSQRLYSHYYHVKRKKDEFINKTGTMGEYIWKNNLSVEEFVLDPACKNYYQKFFYNFPIENFTFVGVMENYETELKYLSKILNVNFTMYNQNKNPEKSNQKYEIDTSLLDQIKKFHDKDYDLFNYMLDISIGRK